MVTLAHVARQSSGNPWRPIIPGTKLSSMNAEIRNLFPVTQNYIYFNHAAVAPLPLPVYERMHEHARDLLENGLVRWREWGAAVERVRELAARFVNARPDEIAFAPNTSAGIGIIANGIDWRAGDNVVTAECEFPANLRPWLRLARDAGIEVRFAREGDGRLETAEILDLIDERTRVVSLSFVEFASGFRNDLAGIGRHCRERDLLFVVDAIQGLGALKLDVIRDHVDAFAADAHKFLLGPEGAALLYLGPRAFDRVRPTIVGWTSVRDPYNFADLEQEYAAGARRFEPGALNVNGVLGLGASIEMFLQVGVEKIETYLLGLTDYLCARLQERGYQIVSSRRPGEASAVVSCRHPRHQAGDLYRRLAAERIITTARLGRLRISPHFYNTKDEIDRLIEVLPD
jgi:cysteine desulfurase/selenocysteine lyase